MAAPAFMPVATLGVLGIGSSAWAHDGIVQRALHALKRSSASKTLVLISDVCVDEYTTHGHCGIVVKKGDEFDVDNDRTIELLGRIAVSHALAGADIVAPSDMMDGRVAAIRVMSATRRLLNLPMAGPLNPPRGRLDEVVVLEDCSQTAAFAYPSPSRTGDATGWTTPMSRVSPSDWRRNLVEHGPQERFEEPECELPLLVSNCQLNCPDFDTDF